MRMYSQPPCISMFTYDMLSWRGGQLYQAFHFSQHSLILTIRFTLKARSTTDRRWTSGRWEWSCTRWSAVRSLSTARRWGNSENASWGASTGSRSTCRPTVKTCSKSFSCSIRPEESTSRWERTFFSDGKSSFVNVSLYALHYHPDLTDKAWVNESKLWF